MAFPTASAALSLPEKFSAAYGNGLAQAFHLFPCAVSAARVL